MSGQRPEDYRSPIMWTRIVHSLTFKDVLIAALIMALAIVGWSFWQISNQGILTSYLADEKQSLVSDCIFVVEPSLKGQHFLVAPFPVIDDQDIVPREVQTWELVAVFEKGNDPDRMGLSRTCQILDTAKAVLRENTERMATEIQGRSGLADVDVQQYPVTPGN